jgi:hypothetical protein
MAALKNIVFYRAGLRCIGCKSLKAYPALKTILATIVQQKTKGDGFNKQVEDYPAQSRSRFKAIINIFLIYKLRIWNLYSYFEAAAQKGLFQCNQ